MPKKDKAITLIGKRLANKGNEFVYLGPSEECEPCKLRKTCHNLEQGKRYRVISVRRSAEHDCLLHDGSVRAVEVSLAPVNAAVEAKKAIKGSTIIFKPVVCEKECENTDFCNPIGLVTRQKYTINKVLKNSPLDCFNDQVLKAVELKEKN
jgi:uncharacterized protein (UPF0179 family)